MPDYTTVNNFQYPRISESPNVETATFPLASGVERRSLLVFTNASERGTQLRNPTTGMICYLSDYDDVQIYKNGAWVSAVPRLYEVPETTLTTTAVTTIATIPVEASVEYIVSGWIYWHSTTDSVTFTPDTASQATGYWRLLQTTNVDANATATFSGSASDRGTNIVHMWFATTASGGNFEIKANKVADAGDDAFIYGGQLLISKIANYV